MFDEETIVNKVKELIAPVLANRQAELVDLICRPQGSRLLLRFLVDTPTGITVETLSHLNQAIGAVLDEHDAIPSTYMLEVSSPGLDRRLKTPLDFERVVGRRLKVTTAVPVNDKREHLGQLLSAGEEFLVLKLDSGEKLKIELSQIAHAVQEISL